MVVPGSVATVHAQRAQHRSVPRCLCSYGLCSYPLVYAPMQTASVLSACKLPPSRACGKGGAMRLRVSSVLRPGYGATDLWYWRGGVLLRVS
eukprot:3392977-Rhodomonas_salina.2